MCVCGASGMCVWCVDVCVDECRNQMYVCCVFVVHVFVCMCVICGCVCAWEGG